MRLDPDPGPASDTGPSDSRRLRPLLVVVAVAALVGAAAAPALGATASQPTSPNFEAFVPQPTLQPGGPNQLTIQLVNDAPAPDDTARPAKDVTVTVSAGGTPIEVLSGRTLLGPMPDGQPRQLAVALDVPFDAPGGSYNLTVTVTYTVGGERRTQELSVTVRVPERSRFRVVDTDVNASVGDTGTVTLTIENTGEQTARAATVTVRSTSAVVGFGGASSTSRFAGTLEPGERTTVTVSVGVAPNAETQSYALRVSVAYTTPGGTPRESRPLAVGFTPGPARSFVLSGVESDLRVGSEGTLNATVTNTGDAPARNAVVVIKVDSPTLTPLEVTYPVGTLAPGESATVSFDLSVSESASAGPRQFTFLVRYTNRDGQPRASDPLHVRQRVRQQRPVFDVRAVDTTVTAGAGTTITVRVTNRGDEVLRDVSAKLFANEPLSSGDDTAYVGRLEPGESVTLTFELRAAGGALAKRYPVSLDFRYTEPDGDTKLSETYKLPVVVSRSGGGGPPTWLLGGAAVVVVALAAGAYLLVRRR